MEIIFHMSFSISHFSLPLAEARSSEFKLQLASWSPSGNLKVEL
jgi:hypothetical protein